MRGGSAAEASSNPKGHPVPTIMDDNFELCMELRKQREQMSVETLRNYGTIEDDDEEAAREHRWKLREERIKSHKAEESTSTETEVTDTSIGTSCTSSGGGEDDQDLLDRLSKREERRQKRMKEALKRQREFDPTINNTTDITFEDLDKDQKEEIPLPHEVTTAETNSWKTENGGKVEDGCVSVPNVEEVEQNKAEEPMEENSRKFKKEEEVEDKSETELDITVLVQRDDENEKKKVPDAEVKNGNEKAKKKEEKEKGNMEERIRNEEVVKLKKNLEESLDKEEHEREAEEKNKKNEEFKKKEAEEKMKKVEDEIKQQEEAKEMFKKDEKLKKEVEENMKKNIKEKHNEMEGLRTKEQEQTCKKEAEKTKIEMEDKWKNKGMGSLKKKREKNARDDSASKHKKPETTPSLGKVQTPGTEDQERLEAERKLGDLKRRRDNADQREIEKMKTKQQQAEADLEVLKKKREERRKVIVEEQERKKQEMAEKKAKEQEERRRMKEEIERRRAEAAEKKKQIEGSSADDKATFSCVGPKGSLKIVEKAEFLNKSAQKSSSVRASHSPIVSKIGSRLDQYTTALQNNKEVKSPKPHMADLPGGVMHNIKNMWEKGNVSKAESAAHTNKDAAGVKLGVAGHVSNWLGKLPGANKAEPASPKPAATVGCMNKGVTNACARP